MFSEGGSETGSLLTACGRRVPKLSGFSPRADQLTCITVNGHHNIHLFAHLCACLKAFQAGEPLGQWQDFYSLHHFSVALWVIYFPFLSQLQECVYGDTLDLITECVDSIKIILKMN